MTGWQTLLYKEVLRFWKVAFQTVAGPVLTAMLYLLIFGHALESHVKVYDQVSYTALLVPGLAMMSVLQNAFANSSSSLIMSKVMGNLVFLMLTPLSYMNWYVAYVGASVILGLVVGLGVVAISFLFTNLTFVAPLWILVFAVMGAALMGTLGLIAGLWAEKFDQLAAFQNFVVMPMTFLSGVFYSIHSLPTFWQGVSHINPFFYMIDGFRHGFFGVSDVSPWLSLGVVGAALAVVSGIAIHLLRTGYKIRSYPPCFHTNWTIDMNANQIKTLIAASLPCEHLELEGDGRHWYATVVSSAFEGKRAIQRHQQVYATLGDKMKTDEVHALSMKTYTPTEWAALA